jgi:hypothetical protein
MRKESCEWAPLEDIPEDTLMHTLEDNPGGYPGEPRGVFQGGLWGVFRGFRLRVLGVSSRVSFSFLNVFIY